MLALRLPEDVEKRLAALAKATGAITLEKRSCSTWRSLKMSTWPSSA